MQPPQSVIGKFRFLPRGGAEKGHAAVGGVVVGIIFRVGLAAERPRLPREAVIAVINVLRALHRAAVGVQLRAADQAAEGIVLEAVTRKLTRRIAVAQARKRAFCVVSIGNVTTAIIRLLDQSVKPAVLSRANDLAIWRNGAVSWGSLPRNGGSLALARSLLTALWENRVRRGCGGNAANRRTSSPPHPARE